MKEIWKDIAGYEGLYQVSNLGNVRSLPRKGCKIKCMYKMKFQLSTNGYYRVSLCKNSKHKKYFVHRLVAETFIPNPNNYPQVNHKDENKLNNKINNLEYCTNSYNINYGNRNNKCAKSMAKHFNKKILCVETGVVYNSIRDATRQTGIFESQICSVCNKKKTYNTAGNYHWMYIEGGEIAND